MSLMQYWVLATASLLTAWLQGCDSDSPSTRATTTSASTSKPTLPEKMIAGYTSGANASTILKAVDKGLNVIFWSFLEASNDTVTTNEVNSDYVASVQNALVKHNRTDVLHFVSIGGWDVPHTLQGTCGSKPCSASAYADSFRQFNDDMKSKVPGFPGFAGIDWDIEGVNDLDSESNQFELSTFEVMMETSKLLKEDFLVSMVPAQSYFDCSTSSFDMSLRHAAASAPADWTYHGRNAYAALFAKCPDCFDLVMVQYYEGYSRAGFELYWDGNQTNVGQKGWPRQGDEARMQEIISKNIQCLMDGWIVDFDGFWGLGNQTLVQVPADKVVVGLGNGWTDQVKFPFFSGSSSGRAWCEAMTGTKRARGFAYWDLGDDSAEAALVSDLQAATQACENAVVIV